MPEKKVRMPKPPTSLWERLRRAFYRILSYITYIFLRKIPSIFRNEPGALQYSLRLPIPVSHFRRPRRTFYIYKPTAKFRVRVRIQARTPASSSIEALVRIKTPIPLLGNFILDFHRNDLLRRIRIQAARIQMEALMDYRRQREISAKVPESAQFPSLRAENFQALDSPLRRVQSFIRARTGRAPALNLPEGGPTQRYLADRIFFMPLAIDKSHLAGLLPPPFVPTEISEPTLILSAEREQGRTDLLRLSLYADVYTYGEKGGERGFLPLFSLLARSRADKFHPALYTFRYNFGPRGLSLGLGDASGKLLFQSDFLMERTIRYGDGLPAFLNTERVLFRQDPLHFTVNRLYEELTYPVNRLYFLEAILQNPAHSRRPDISDYISRRLGLPVQAGENACFLTRLEVQASSLPLPLYHAQYRLPGPAETVNILGV